ncbi:hypothetical protein [Capsulimonas corticalis]|nr:hypothetical protein [Capsulimonas corticalis]
MPELRDWSLHPATIGAFLLFGATAARADAMRSIRLPHGYNDILMSFR